MKRTLFEIGADALALNDLLDELQGDISNDGDAEAIDEWLNETGDALAAKLDSYHGLIKEHAVRATALKAEAKAIAELAASHESRANRLKERLKYFMETQGVKKYPVSRGEFAICGNGGKQPLVVNIEPQDLPDAYRILRYEADGEAIRAALEFGLDLPFAQLQERGTHLRVR